MFDGRTDLNRDEDIIHVLGMFFRKCCAISIDCERFYGKNFVLSTLPNCPECVSREKNTLKKQYQMEAEKAEAEGKDYLIPNDRDIGNDIEIPMKLDPSTKHFICKRCGLYATREQISDIRHKLNQRESTKEDKQYDYLEWWQKSKKDK